jgi:hypothetical protein
MCVSVCPLISVFEPGKLNRIGQFSLANNVILEWNYSDILREFCSRKSWERCFWSERKWYSYFLSASTSDCRIIMSNERGHAVYKETVFKFLCKYILIIIFKLQYSHNLSMCLRKTGTSTKDVFNFMASAHIFITEKRYNCIDRTPLQWNCMYLQL